MIKKRIIPHEAAESFGWTFLHSFDVLKSENLHRLTAKMSGSYFWNHLFTVKETWKEKTIVNSRHLGQIIKSKKAKNVYFAVKYHFKLA